ncbi:MAG: response regulator transcription factor [Thermoleophilia bacterium]|nr:response regulator transcription factor [Thermoleophilia bacterium]
MSGTRPAPDAPARVLLVEDEEAIADAVAFGLRHAGFAVDVLNDGVAAAAVDPDAYDVVLLDLMLPGLSGYEVCRAIRARSIVPVIMLTARTDETDRILGLEIGADDYVPKPFSMGELVGRVRAILRRRLMDRADREAAATREVGDLRLDLVRRTIAVGDRPVDLTPLEFRLVAVLAERPGQVVTRREIVAQVWRSTHPGDRRACDVHVKNVRRKLERDPAHPERLVTVRGVGYMLREP